MQLVQLRFRAVCAVCSSKLPPRAEAWQDGESSRTVCLSCHRIEVQAQAAEAAAEFSRNRVPVPDLNRAPRLRVARPGEPEDDDLDGGFDDEGVDGPALRDLDAGLDADLIEQELLAEQAEIARLRQEADEREAAAEAAGRERAKSGITLPRPKRQNGPRVITEPLSAAPPAKSAGGRGMKLPTVGPSLAAGIEADRSAANDASTDAIFRALEAARPHGLEIIRSRPWVGTRVESEAIVVGPSGVWIVDGLGSTDGPVEKGFLAGHAGSELLNVVGGRTSIISGLLFDSSYQWVPVRGALCFDSGVPGWFDAPFSLAGIAITTPRDLIDALFMPAHLDTDTRKAVAQHLVNRF